jgi:hypothetical protein
MSDSIRFIKQGSGVYTTPDWRFVLERRGGVRCGTVRWRLRERGKLLGYKPGKTPRARQTSPLWLQTDNARGAVAWAKYAVAGMVVF